MSNRPLRHPDTSSPEFMTRRAWWLLGSNLVIPGTGPLLAGNRRFGRLGLRIWLGVLLALLVTVLLFFVFRGPLFFVLSTWWGLTILGLCILVLGLWMCLTVLETVRQVQLFRVDAMARGLILALALIIGVIPVFVAGYLTSQVFAVRTAVSNLFGDENAGMKFPSDGRINIMMLGGDTGEDREGTRPDSISVMSFDSVSGQLTTVGLPRTLTGFSFSEGPMQEMYPESYDSCAVDVCYLNSVYTEVTTYDYDMYADAKAHGSDPGIEATRDAVEWITGLQIHYYVMVDMSGFAALVDAMGGVEVDVKERVGLGINDDGSPDWQPPSVYIEPGKQTLNGEMALWYARSRYETTDYARMKRQRELQDAIIAQLPKAMMSRSSQILKAIEEVVRTDIPEGAVGLVADLALKSRGRDDNVRVDLAPPVLEIEDITPDYEYARELIHKGFAGEAPPTEAPAAPEEEPVE
ncbi:LCP family protein [Gulosibacter bifidus]|uniref:LCP family protein n=1 Tax=Gulosibacter bifidus TaxID=272239 RepID=A0ABW5RJ28_9MICO|nr:LCP family protein [Gulosibacter bifidus]